MSDEMIGRQLGSYRIEELTARSGMVEEYRGYHVEMERQVAIKVIGRHLEPDPLLNERFWREARATVQLRHPNIVKLYDFGEEGGGHYAVMELVEGITLADLIQDMLDGQRYVDQDDISFITRQIASALDYAHSQGVVHHDINPTTVILRPSGQALVTDFGLAVLKARMGGDAGGSGAALGTPEYMAPEKAIDASRVTLRSDIYSLGIILYQLTTGSLPFTAETPVELSLKHINETPVSPHQANPTVRRAASRVIMMAMAKDPKNRFESAMALADALTQAWYIDDDEDVVPLKNGSLRRQGESEPLAPRTTLPSEMERQETPPPAPAQPAEPVRQIAPKPPERKRKQRVSPLVVVAVVVALLVLGGIFGGRALGLDAGGLLRGVLGRPSPSAEEPLTVATATPEAASSPTTEPEAGIVTATPVVTIVPDTAPVDTPEPATFPRPGVGTRVLRLADTSAMVFVPEGVFLMGTDDPSRPTREGPLHEVVLSGYWIDQTEVTNAQYKLCVESGACPPPQSLTHYNDPRYTNFPVAFVTWDAASAYCEEMSRATGLDVRLPTEAQWEKAASWDPLTETKRPYPWGDEPPNPGLLRYVESFPALLEGEEVGSYPAGASAYGALDMAGNVQEFVFDWSSEDYYGLPEAAVDPQGPAEGSGRVIRGGGWANPAPFASTTRRTVVETTTNGEDIGFRCATNAVTLSPENNVAFTPQEALGGAQAAVALALAQGEGSDAVLSDWQAALIAMDAQLEAGNNAEVLLDINSRLDTLDVLVETDNLPAATAVKLRNTLNWVRSQLATGAAPTDETPVPAENTEAVG